MFSKYYVPAGSSADGQFTTAVTPESAGWSEASLWTLELPPGADAELQSGENEIIVLPLSGSALVSSDGADFSMTGRLSVFDGPSDFAYIGRDSRYAITSDHGGRFALCGARARAKLPNRYVSAEDVPVELRGAGNCSRQVHNFATAETFAADSIIACEVITPSGNWSSYPSHKHDENSEIESALEEIYYFEIDRSPTGTEGFGYHRVYGTRDRPIEVLEEVRSGDVVLVPHGYHGPSIAAPGHNMYYLNIMAGPGEIRAWNICDDPAHTWLRGTWDHQDIDPRLPLRSHN
ncbi:5-deoxy-glucuronate isomerase [Rhodococcus sp. NPDC049939]|uniref:5-deoxy-glucuronate isomerase n=1 Tax=Rhodococcus sp. NPDC049939 TaxID=3155511 RepID=UPI0033C68559